MVSKLVLGTANFGLDYGVANKTGMLAESEIGEIINTAHKSKIFTIDTAQSYGNSEQTLSKFINGSSNIITKIANLADRRYSSVSDIKSFAKQSLTRLGINKIYGLLLHTPEDLLSDAGQNISHALIALKSEGLIQKLGVSIYEPENLPSLMKVLPIDLLQAPFNIFDNRILASGSVDMLKDKGIEIHIRSAFLQGLLLMKKEFVPSKLIEIHPSAFSHWYKMQSETGLAPDFLSLKYCLQHDWVDKVVVGVDSAKQLQRLVEIEQSTYLPKITGINCEERQLIDPSKWSVA